MEGGRGCAYKGRWRGEGGVPIKVGEGGRGCAYKGRRRE